MKQKYLLSKDDGQKKVVLQELIELDVDKYSLVCEERYPFDAIMPLLDPSQKNNLLEVLRTKNMYPILYYSEKIADAIVSFFDSDDPKEPIELFFDDIDYIKRKFSNVDEALEADDDIEIDEILEDDDITLDDDVSPIANLIDDDIDGKGNEEQDALKNLDLSPIKVSDADNLQIEGDD